MINRERLLDFFKTVCKIPSRSMNEAQISFYLRKVLEELGFECYEDDAGEKTGGNAGNLYGYLKGNSKYKSICYVAHMDSVENLTDLNIIQEGNIIRSDGNTILGADDKAGISIIIEAVRTLLESGKEHGDIYVLFAVQEENGKGTGYINTDKLKPDMTFNFDETVPALSFETDGPTEFRIDYKISMEKTEEERLIAKRNQKYFPVNPITVAARCISAVEDLTDDPEIMSNIGYINGGNSKFKIPTECSVDILIRSDNDKKVREMADKISLIFSEECKKANAVLGEEKVLIYKAFRIDENDEMYKLVLNTCASMGEKPVIRDNFDCFDTSELNALGLKTITVSTGYENFHKHTEFLNLDQFYKNAEFAARMLYEITLLQ